MRRLNGLSTLSVPVVTSSTERRRSLVRLDDAVHRGAMDLPHALVHRARHQGGVVSRGQLVGSGVSGAEIRWRLGRRWRLVLPGVVLLDPGLPSVTQRQVAALFYAGPDSWLAGPTTLDLLAGPRQARLSGSTSWYLRRTGRVMSRGSRSDGPASGMSESSNGVPYGSPVRHRRGRRRSHPRRHRPRPEPRAGPDRDRVRDRSQLEPSRRCCGHPTHRAGDSGAWVASMTHRRPVRREGPARCRRRRRIPL